MNFKKFSLALGIAVFALTSCGGSPEAKQVEEREKQEKKDSISLIYNPAETQFLKKAAARGAVTKNGQDMLIFQAEKAWKIWNKH